MSHNVKVTIFADQEIKLLGTTVNVHDLDYLVVSSFGEITDYRTADKGNDDIGPKVNVAPIFKLHELVGRNINIRSFRSEDVELVAAQDTITGELFVLKEIWHGALPR